MFLGRTKHLQRWQRGYKVLQGGSIRFERSTAEMRRLFASNNSLPISRRGVFLYHVSSGGKLKLRRVSRRVEVVFRDPVDIAPEQPSGQYALDAREMHLRARNAATSRVPPVYMQGVQAELEDEENDGDWEDDED